MRARENLFSPLLFLWQALTSTVGNNGSGHTNNIILWFIHWGSRAKLTHTFLVCNTHAVPRGLLTPVVSPSVLLRLRHPVVTGAIFTVVLWVILADRQYTGVHVSGGISENALSDMSSCLLYFIFLNYIYLPQLVLVFLFPSFSFFFNPFSLFHSLSLHLATLTYD